MLTLAEREEISRGLSVGHSLREIVRTLQRSPSMISREIARNGGRQPYRATEADKAAWARARRPKVCRLAVLNFCLASIIVEALQSAIVRLQYEHDIPLKTPYVRVGSEN